MSDQDQDLQQDPEFDQICTSLPPIKVSISGDGDGGPPSSAKSLYGGGRTRYEEEEECRTPTSEENKIPVTCPPAPKKLPVAPMREKRKRKSLRSRKEFFEVVNQNEVDGFFRVLERGDLFSTSRPVVKKRRRIRAGL